MTEPQNRWPLLTILVCTMTAIAFGGQLLLRGPSFIDAVKIVNLSEYDIHVEVNGGDQDGWLSVTTADNHATTTAVDVVDQGTTWVFRFSAQGRQGGELRITRTDLKQTDWTIQIPDHVTTRIREEGVLPPP